VIRRARHLHDNQIFECYVAERGSELLDPPLAEHLSDCQSCGARYAELARFMDALRAEADAETDAMFPAERLQAQQRDIARRIESVARPARVISFPGQVMQRTMAATSSRTAPRWAAAAAAAGLFIGIALGASWESRGPARQTTVHEATETRASRLTAAAGTRSALTTDGAADDAFLSELEFALDRPRTRELVAFDAFTPHVREIRDIR
jgi:anti-sigma factor RsiW